MMDTRQINLEAGAPYPQDLSQRIRNGEVFVARQCLQQLDLFDEIRATSFAAIRLVAGDNIADTLQREGLEHIHRYCPIEQIAEITNAIYDLAENKASGWVSRIAPELLQLKDPYYFEKSPNIRFITPYDFMAEGKKALEEFMREHGGGKMTPHPPHRDSWVDCPDNVINVWIAVGPIPKGNGLTIYPDVFRRDCDWVAPGALGYQENPGKPLHFDLEPGDAILFDGEHLHSTVLNYIKTTRHVISFRIVDGKPNYPNGHYHHYLHSSLAKGPLSMFAEVPANIAPGWVTTRLRWVAEKLRLKEKPSTPKNWKKHPLPGDEKTTFPLSSLPLHTLKPVNDHLCVARVADDKVLAFNRRCPHDGADFAVGSIDNGNIVCPWHSLPFDIESGKSPCKNLGKLRFYETKVDGDTVTVLTGKNSTPVKEADTTAA